MATYRTKSGLNKLVFLSNEIADALSQEAILSNKSPSWVVRQALLEYLSGKGYKFTHTANPEGRGYRSDLKRPLAETLLDRRMRK